MAGQSHQGIWRRIIFLYLNFISRKQIRLQIYAYSSEYMQTQTRLRSRMSLRLFLNCYTIIFLMVKIELQDGLLYYWTVRRQRCCVCVSAVCRPLHYRIDVLSFFRCEEQWHFPCHWNARCKFEHCSHTSFTMRVTQFYTTKWPFWNH